jgi:hypothetical protein
LFSRFLACLGLLTISLAREPLVVLNEIKLDQIDQRITADQLAALNIDRFVLLDRSNNELVLLDESGIVNKVGGFGQGEDSFAEPVDFIDHKLQVRVCDRYDNSVKCFDHQLNYLGTEYIDQAEYDPFFPDLITPDPFGSVLVLSREYGLLLNIEQQTIPVIDLNQFGISGECIIDMTSDKEGNIALLSCHNELFRFNRFGRKLSSIAVEIDDPVIVLSGINSWTVLNATGNMQTNAGIRTYPMVEDEEIIDADTYFQYLILLTNKRILVLK